MRFHPGSWRLHALLLALVAIGCSTVATPPPVANDSSDPEFYRARKVAATETFLDSRNPKPERLSAAQRLGYPEDDTFAAMLRVGADPAEDDEIRWEALRQHRFDGAYLKVVLAILANPQDGGDQLNADLIEDIGRRTTFQLPVELEQKIVETLRDLLDDQRDRVRLAAYRVLVATHDTVAVSKLTDALRRNDSPIPLPEAVRLLDIDGSIYHLEVLRPFLMHSEDAVRAEAARALAVDPDSRPNVVELATDPQTAEAIRLQAIRALAREDEQFGDYAIGMVADREDSPTVRQAAMKAFVGRMNYFKVGSRQQIQFAQVVEQLASEGGPENNAARQLRSEAKELLDYLKRAFPVIERHYAAP